MSKKMLIDATHKEETRVAVVDEQHLVEFDYESTVRKQVKGNIYLAKVTRVEPSLQAAFVNYGGNRHGFLPFSEIHPDYFRIPVSDREALLAAQQAEIERLDALHRNDDEDIIDNDEESESDDTNEDDDEAVVELGGADKPADEEDSDLKAKKPSRKKKARKSKKQDEDRDIAEVEEQNADASDGVDGNVKADSDDKAEDQQSDGKESSAEADGDSEEQKDKPKNNKRGRNNRRRNNNRRAPMRGKKGQEVVEGDESDKPFRFNLRHQYKIQEVVKRGQIVLIQVSKEERGNKGAAVTTYLSLPGRYCVLMPNSPRGGGVSRKIGNFKDRKRMREILKQLEIPDGMSVILRTAGVARTKAEIKRDLDYLVRLWNTIREQTLQSSAPALINEEGNLIKRSIRDLYTRDIDDVLVSGERGYKTAKEFMKMLVPSHAKKVQEYDDAKVPLFHRYHVEKQINAIGQIEVVLKSGGYLVINPTEALVSVDVNSGKATKERHIEATAVKTNLEAAQEVARQLRLRDLGGLVVIDFIDMEDRRNNRKVENKLRDSLSDDRARIQVGRISSFGLLELSRQRLNPSLTEAQFDKCPHCEGSGVVKTMDFAAISSMRAIEEEGIKGQAKELSLHVPNDVAVYILNNKKQMLVDIETRYEFRVHIRVDETLMQSDFKIEILKKIEGKEIVEEDKPSNDDNNKSQDGQKKSRRRGRRGGRKNRPNNPNGNQQQNNDVDGNKAPDQPDSDGNQEAQKKPARKKTQSQSKTKDTKSSPQDTQEVKESASKGDAKKPEKKAPKKAAKKKPAVKKEAKKVNAQKASNDSKPSDENHASNFETVNAEPQKKKKGWWNKLID